MQSVCTGLCERSFAFPVVLSASFPAWGWGLPDLPAWSSLHFGNAAAPLAVVAVVPAVVPVVDFVAVLDVDGDVAARAVVVANAAARARVEMKRACIMCVPPVCRSSPFCTHARVPVAQRAPIGPPRRRGWRALAAATGEWPEGTSA